VAEQSTSRRLDSPSSRGNHVHGKGELCVGVPMDSQAERALVACVLMDPMAAKDECLDLIEDKMFTHPGYRKIVNTVKMLIAKGETVDLVSVHPHLHETLDPVDLAQIYGETVPSAAAIMTHFARVVEVFRKRRYWELGYKLTSVANRRDETGSAVSLRTYCEQVIEEADQIGSLPRIHSVKDVLPKALAEIQPLEEREPGLVLSLGLPRLDEMLVGGLHRGHLYVIAARPSVGKTTLAWNMAANMVLEDNPVLFVSLETREETLVHGLLSRSSGVNSYHLTRGTYDQMAANRLQEASEDVGRLPLYICDDARITMGGLRTMVRAAKAKYGVAAVFIDYLQLITPEGNGQESRQVQVSMISRDAKLLAMEQEIPIVMLAQLSRKTEVRENKKPQLADLRESGSIEQDADVVCLIYRDGYYDRENDDGRTELIIAKQRHGPCGTIPLMFNPAIGEFSEWDEGGLD